MTRGDGGEPVARALDAAGRALGRPVTLRAQRPLSGGCIHDARMLDTDAGRFFVKSSEKPCDAFFSAEAAGLDALSRASPSLVVPRVIAHRDPAPDTAGWIVLEYIEHGSRRADFDDTLGRGLAELHAHTAEAFGFYRDTFCGTTRQPNPWTEGWTDFYREHRIERQLRLGSGLGLYDRQDRLLFERLLSRLDVLLDAGEPPALLHGDLWSGNLLVTGRGAPALIDPATYFGHREAEIGMMTLFGGFSSRVLAAYEEVKPLAPGWRDRNPLYELYHVMNHATLFGGHYAGRAVALASRFA